MKQKKVQTFLISMLFAGIFIECSNSSSKTANETDLGNEIDTDSPDVIIDAETDPLDVIIDAESADTGSTSSQILIGQPNIYSWDGSWEPTPEQLPPPGLYDDQYGDGHPDNHGAPTPILTFAR